MLAKKILMLSLLLGIAFQTSYGQSKRKRFIGADDPLPCDASVKIYGQKWMKGTIISDDTYELVLIKENGDTLTIDYNSIKKVVKNNKNNITLLKNGKYHYNKGLFANYTFGSAIAEETGIIRSSFLIGYRRNDRFSYGVGLGMNIVFEEYSGGLVSEEYIFMSLNGYARYNLNLDANRVFISGNIGHSIIKVQDDFFNTDYRAGLNFMPGVGVAFGSRGASRFVLEFGMATQWIRGKYNDTVNNTSFAIEGEYKNLMIRPMMNLTFEFR